MDEDIRDGISVLNGPHDTLQIIAEAGKISQNEITARSESSQSTISRNLGRLQELGLIRQTGPTYSLTLLGDLVVDEFNAFTSKLSEMFEAKQILKNLDVDVPFDPALLKDANVTVSDPHLPDGALSPLLRLTERADRIEAVAGMLHAGYADTFEERILDSDLEAEFIVTHPVANVSRQEYEDRQNLAESTDQIELYKLDIDVPFSLMRIWEESGRRTVVTVSTNSAHGTIISTNEHAWTWAGELLSQYREKATDWNP